MSVTVDADTYGMRRLTELRALTRLRAKRASATAWASAINAQSLDRVMSRMPASRTFGTGRSHRLRRKDASVAEQVLSNPLVWVVAAISKIALVAGVVTVILARHWTCPT